MGGGGGVEGDLYTNRWTKMGMAMYRRLSLFVGADHGGGVSRYIDRWMDKDGDGHLSNIEFIVRRWLWEQGRGRAKGGPYIDR